MTLSRKSNWTQLVVIVFIAAIGVSAQAEWLKDASDAKIPAGSVKGEINGKPVTFTHGRLRKSGGMKLGELEFPHYTLYLSDAENALSSKFSAQVIVTVRKGEVPDAKVFRSNLAPRETRAGLRGEGYWIPELYSVYMSSRRGEEFGSGDDIVSAEGKEDLSKQDFTGRVEIDRRKADKITARVYICYNDKKKSWIAGSVDLDIE